MSQFILRFQGRGEKPALDVARVRSLNEVTILDDSSPRMLLVKAPQSALAALMPNLPNWLVVEEEMTRLPDTRKKIRGTE